jgi:hypothetical protein
MATNYTPTPEELKPRASLFWPDELRAKEEAISIIPKLIKTQDKFISILDVAELNPSSWKDVLAQTKDFPANLFLKHLMVLADVGVEPLKRIGTELKKIFADGKMVFMWREQSHEYTFKKILHGKKLNGKSLSVDGKSLAVARPLDDYLEDVTMLLLFGSAVINTKLPAEIGEKCMIGSLIGKSSELKRFVKERYIFVSKITSGAKSNALGQIAQNFVRDHLQEALPNWKITRNGQILGISQNDGVTDMDFDIVAVSPSKKYFAIEVSYQVTTNSVIERKMGQALNRAALVHKAGHKIVYVIDGAGNFERQSALGTICKYSDCTVALTRKELEVLVEFLAANGK